MSNKKEKSVLGDGVPARAVRIRQVKSRSRHWFQKKIELFPEHFADDVVTIK